MSGHGPEIVLVRHGETEWSRDGRHTGRTDIALTALGERQAQRLAAALSGRSFARILCSPLRRARDTLAHAGLDGAPELLDELQEWDYGDYESRTTHDIRADVPDWTAWTHPILGGETVEHVGQRADAVIARIGALEADVAVFAHGHMLRVLAARWLGLPARGGRLLALDTASVSALGFERGVQVLRRWNDLSHLRGLV